MIISLGKTLKLYFATITIRTTRDLIWDKYMQEKNKLLYKSGLCRYVYKTSSELDALLVRQRDEHFEGGHEGGDLCESGPGDHAGVEGDGVGVVGALQVRAEPVQRVERRLRQLERRNGNLVMEIDDGNWEGVTSVCNSN